MQTPDSSAARMPRAKKLAIHIGADASRRVGTMLDRQNPCGLAASRRDVGRGTIGCLGDVALPARGNLCFCTGWPIHGPDVDDLANAASAQRWLPACDGAFAGIFWDAQREFLVVVTDCLGMQPLYMRHVDGELTLVSETKALHGDPDLGAWGAFISLGHPVGERSLLSGLQRVPAASILTYDCARHQLNIRRYWHWPAPTGAWRRYDFLEALEADIHACAAFGDPGSVLLSGGFDSRLLLFLLRRARIGADALIVSHDDEHDDADGRLAEAVATSSGIPFRKARPPRDFFSTQAYLDYLAASDAGHPSMDLFIAKVASQIRARAVWDGLVPGFVFMPLHQYEGGFEAYLQAEVRGTGSAAWKAAGIVFRPEVVEAMSEGFSGDLRSVMSRLPQDGSGLARFVIENRSRHRACMNPLKVYANRADAFTPGLSKDFMSHAAMIPFEEKQHGRFYRQLLARLDKRSLAVPFLSGGQLMKGARINPAYGRERMRIVARGFRARHPSLFAGAKTSRPERSAFLGRHLFEEDDPWIDPRACKKLATPGAGNELAWKLLFHWKAWQWLHEGRLDRMLGDKAR